MEKHVFEEDPADVDELREARDLLRDCEAAEAEILFSAMIGEDVSAKLADCRELADRTRAKMEAALARLDAAAPIIAQRVLIAEWAAVRSYDPDRHAWLWISKHSEKFRELWTERPEISYVRANLYRNG